LCHVTSPDSGKPCRSNTISFEGFKTQLMYFHLKILPFSGFPNNIVFKLIPEDANLMRCQRIPSGIWSGSEDTSSLLKVGGSKRKEYQKKWEESLYWESKGGPAKSRTSKASKHSWIWGTHYKTPFQSRGKNHKNVIKKKLIKNRSFQFWRILQMVMELMQDHWRKLF
jgi:hypothetical protein